MDTSGISAAGGIMSSLANMAIATTQLDYQRLANQQARQDQMYYYEDQKNWLSPANQMRLKALAGLNPYSDFTTGGVSQPQPVNLAEGMSDGFNNLSSALSQGMRNRFERLSQKIAFKQLELMEKRTDKDLLKTDTEIKKLSSEVTYQDILNEFEKAANPEKLRYQTSLADTQYWQSLMAEIDAEYRPERNAKEMDLLLEQIFNQRLQNEYLPKEYGLKVSDLALRQAQWDLQKDIMENEKLQSDWDVSTIKALDEYIDKLDKDKNLKPGVKAALKGIYTIAKLYFQSKKPAKIYHNHFN